MCKPLAEETRGKSRRAGANACRAYEIRPVFQFRLKKNGRRATLRILERRPYSGNESLRAANGFAPGNYLRGRRCGSGDSNSLTQHGDRAFPCKRADGAQPRLPILRVRVPPPQGAHVCSAFLAASWQIGRNRRRGQRGEHRCSANEQDEQCRGKTTHDGSLDYRKHCSSAIGSQWNPPTSLGALHELTPDSLRVSAR